MTRWCAGMSLVLLVACQPDDRPKVTVPPMKKDLPRPKAGSDTPANAGSRAPTGDRFRPDNTLRGADGRYCTLWGDRAVLLRPRDDGQLDLRVRATGDDLDVTCAWDGPVLATGSVRGEPLGRVGDHLVFHQPLSESAGRVFVVDLTTGRLVRTLDPAFSPTGGREPGTLAFMHVLPPALERGEGPCMPWIPEAWNATLAVAREQGLVHPDLEPQPPICDTVATRTCKLVFAFPQQVTLPDGAVEPSPGRGLCVGLP